MPRPHFIRAHIDLGHEKTTSIFSSTDDDALDAYSQVTTRIAETRGYLGLHGRAVPIPTFIARLHGLTQPRGVEVMQIELLGAAHGAKLREGDIVIALAEETVETVDDLHRLLTKLSTGKTTAITVLREGRKLALEITPKMYPSL